MLRREVYRSRVLYIGKRGCPKSVRGDQFIGENMLETAGKSSADGIHLF